MAVIVILNKSLLIEIIFLSHTHTLFVQAERDHVSKHLKEQDLLLDTARRNIQAELQVTISEKLTLQKELWVTHTFTTIKQQQGKDEHIYFVVDVKSCILENATIFWMKFIFNSVRLDRWQHVAWNAIIFENLEQNYKR